MTLSLSLPMTQGTLLYRYDRKGNRSLSSFNNPLEHGEGGGASGTNHLGQRPIRLWWKSSIINHPSLVLIGNYGATNVGDEAVCAGLLRLFASSYPDAAIVVLSYDPARTTALHGCQSSSLLPFGFRSFFRLGWVKTLRILRKADRVYIGGGALLTDEKIFAMFLWGWQVFIAKMLCGRVSLVANTIGPLRTKLGNIVMKAVLRCVGDMSVRDEESAAFPRRFRFTKPMSIGADPAFLLDPVMNIERKKRIIISLRPWMSYPPDVLPTLASWVNGMTEEGYEFVFLPLQTLHDDDRVVLRNLFRHLKNKELVSIVGEPQTLAQILTHIASSQLVIGMRLHSLILATLQATPFLALSYSDKVRNFCEDIGMGEWCIPLQDVNETILREKATRVFEQAKEIRVRLAMVRMRMKERASHMLSP